jgi:hypothetical protein
MEVHDRRWHIVASVVNVVPRGERVGEAGVQSRVRRHGPGRRRRGRRRLLCRRQRRRYRSPRRPFLCIARPSSPARDEDDDADDGEDKDANFDDNDGPSAAGGRRCAARWSGGIRKYYGSSKEGEGDKEFDGVTMNSMGVALD